MARSSPGNWPARGYDLILHGRRLERLAGLADELPRCARGGRSRLVADLAEPAGVAAVEKCVTGLDALALLVNNAGFGVGKTFAKADLVGQAEMLNVHMLVPMRLTHAALPGMLARRGGRHHQRGVAGRVYGAAGQRQLLRHQGVSAGLFAGVGKLRCATRGSRCRRCAPASPSPSSTPRPAQGGFGPDLTPRFLWGSARAVVADSLRAFDRGQVVCVPGVVNHMILALARTGLVNRLAPALLGRAL